MTKALFPGLLRWLAFALALLMPMGVIHAQTQEQLEIFRNLTPEQQRAVLEAMEGRATAGAGRGADRARTLEPPEIVQPRTVGEDARSRLQLQEGPPRLVPRDTILLNLELKRFEDQNLVPLSADPRTQVPADRGTRNGTTPQPQVQTPVPPLERRVIQRTEQEEARLLEMRDRIHRRNPYQLDKWGILNVPELGPIPLNGLTVEEATRRLSAEWQLNDFIVQITQLPLLPVGTEALQPFGYDLFAGIPSTFAPATDIPVPAEYVVGPGDTIEVQLFGNTTGHYSLVVGRDGRVDFPEIGPVAVSGMRFEDVRRDLERRVRDQMIGTQASINIGELRSIRVFVLGDAHRPGSYTVSGLSTVTNALFVSGGVKPIGSLRKIELKRNGRTVTTLDLYDLLLRGDTSADARLLPGDVIFIPPVGATVSVAGEVRRPAIYELKEESTVGDALRLAGGLVASADPTLATIERITEARQRTTIDVNLASQSGLATKLRSGDILRIRAIRPVLENSVALHGHVYRPGEYQFRPGMKLLDLIPTIDELKPNADLRYVLVKRELPPDRRITVFSTDLEQAFADPTSSANFELAPRDELHVFDLESGRDRIVEPLLRAIRLQSRIDEPSQEVSISGRVKVPGTYPLEPGMRLVDLLRAGGGLSEAAYGGQAELTRYTITEDDSRRADLIEIDLRAALAGDPAANIPLRQFDHVVIKEVPLWASQEEVEVRGEVRFPGRYPIRRGETLSSLLRRAGGLTDFAFPEGAVFTRKELQERERRQLETLAKRMQADLAQLSLQAAQEGGRDAEQALSVGQTLFTALRESEPVGRVVIDLERAARAAAGSQYDLILKGGDRLIVPRVTQEVTVIGEVQSATSHLYQPNLSRDDYIAKSGGITPRGDDDHVYVVRANGSVETRSSNSWFSGGGVEIRPGDTIVVPLDTERMRPLPFWQAVTSIVYNLAISAAAVNSF